MYAAQDLLTQTLGLPMIELALIARQLLLSLDADHGEDDGNLTWEESPQDVAIDDQGLRDDAG